MEPRSCDACELGNSAREDCGTHRGLHDAKLSCREVSRRAGRARKGARRTLEERRNSDDDLDCIAEGRVEQPRECLSQLERELICRGAEQLDEQVNPIQTTRAPRL